jgi:hypothetical protein
MAKLWTKEEIKHLKHLLAKYGRGAEYNKDRLAGEFRTDYPHRTAVSVKKKMQTYWQSKQYTLDYNPVDVAFTQQITKTDIIRHYRDMGLRGKVTIELGD